MQKLDIRYSAAAAAVAAAVCYGTNATAQNNIVVQPQPAAPSAAPPAPAAPVVVAPQTPPPAPVVVDGGPVEGERVRTFTRPDRRLLMSGLIFFGAPYVASVSVAATSARPGDGDLWIPAAGPWLDLGARPGCSGDCGTETGDRVLLVADGILQTVGLLQIVGAFVFPETYGPTTVVTGKAGESLTFAPSRMGRAGYGLSAIATF